MSESVTWAQALRRLTVPSADELTQPLGNGWLRCFSCGHACKIPPGRPGICQVRFNDAGTLRVPHGYVGALACDPIEKKPFFHALPGTEALSFGMLGCDLHCAYCFPADTMVATDQGPMTLERIFERCRTTLTRPDGEIAFDPGLRVVSATGVARPVRAAFRHPYRGQLVEIRVPALPPLRCTPNHRLLVTRSQAETPGWVEARQLQPGEWLTIPQLSLPGENTEPDSCTLDFSWAAAEEDLMSEVESLLRDELQLEPRRAARERTSVLTISESDVALCLEMLCGKAGGRIPPPLFRAPRRVVGAFVRAVARGLGDRDLNGRISMTTPSRHLAWGLAQLCLGLGSLPAVEESSLPEASSHRGRRGDPFGSSYRVEWFEDGSIERGAALPNPFLVPVVSIHSVDFEGYVYNLEVETEHNYLAGLIAVSNCQNWETSQAIRDPKALAPPRSISAHDLVQLARRRGASTVASTYNEPLITSEWAVEVFREAKKQGFRTAYISNGNGTPQVLEYLRPWVDLYKVDLKGFQDRSYRQLGGRLDRILDTIPRLVEMGFWVEIVTLVIPGFNDSDAELGEMARWLAGISPDIPWHVTGFHKDYKMTDPDDTPVQTLVRAWDIGRNAGLRYVYAGNRPGRVGDRENTRCPQCGALLIERFGFQVLGNRLLDGKCPDCATPIPGVWS